MRVNIFHCKQPVVVASHATCMGLGISATGKRVVVLGLDNAGKTTLINKMCDNSAVTLPTLGFTETTIKLEQNSAILVEVGGQRTLRSTWEKFLHSLNALIWVVDSADERRMQEVALELDLVMETLQASKKKVPILIVANKADLPQAMTETEVAQRLSLHTFSLDYTVVSCSALIGDTSKLVRRWVSRKLFGPQQRSQRGTPGSAAVTGQVPAWKQQKKPAKEATEQVAETEKEAAEKQGTEKQK